MQLSGELSEVTSLVMSDNKSEEFDKAWGLWFTSSAFSVDKRLRQIFRMLPRDPRCKFCNAPFQGVGGLMVRALFGKQRYVRRTIKVAQKLARVMVRQEIPVGIGVHAGVAYFGVVGTADSLTSISAIGDEVNTAARLASQAAAGEIIVSEPALKAAGIDGSKLESRGLELKGISEPVFVRVMHK